MVYTVTFNPALDYVMNVKELSTDDINRTESEELYYGGKGINVSAILSRLDIPTVALGFTAGFTGDKLREMMNDDGIKNDFVKLNSGFTRINVKVKYGKELDINAKGPRITPDETEELLQKLKQLNCGDYLVLAGSVPASLPDDLYSNILEELSGRNINTVVDTTGNQLLNVLKYKPFLIKPNHHELGEIFGQKMNTTEKIKGIGVSPGYAVGKAVIIKETEIDVNSFAFTSTEEELQKFQNAVSIYTKQTRELIDSLTQTAGKENAEILNGHLVMLNKKMSLSGCGDNDISNT